MTEVFETKLRKLRLEYMKKQREIQNEQSARILPEGEKQGARQEEAGRAEDVVEHVADVELHDNGGGGNLPAPEGQDPKGAPRPVKRKKATRKKG